MRTRAEERPRETDETFARKRATPRAVAARDRDETRAQGMLRDGARVQLVAVAIASEDDGGGERLQAGCDTVRDEVQKRIRLRSAREVVLRRGLRTGKRRRVAEVTLDAIDLDARMTQLRKCRIRLRRIADEQHAIVLRGTHRRRE